MTLPTPAGWDLAIALLGPCCKFAPVFVLIFHAHIPAPGDLSQKLQAPNVAARDALSFFFLDEYCANDMFCFDYLNVRTIAPARDSRDASMVGGMPF